MKGGKKEIFLIRLAGLLFILTFAIPIMNWLFIFSRLINIDNPVETINNILANDLLIRLGIVIEVFISILILCFSFTLYSLLKKINKNIALLAVFFRSVEATLTSVMALGHFLILIILKNISYSKNINNDIIFNYAGSFFNMYISLTSIYGIFFGLSMILFVILLYKSNYLSHLSYSFAIISYILVVLYDTIQILFPTVASSLIVTIVGTAPVCIIQIFIGLWLFIFYPNKQFKYQNKQGGNT